MKNHDQAVTRRNALKTFGLGSAAGALGLLTSQPAYGAATPVPDYSRGLPKVTITNIKTIATKPRGSNLIVVKVETSEPGLYGLGCATFTQRAVAVVAAIEGYMNDFCKGKDVDQRAGRGAPRITRWLD